MRGAALWLPMCCIVVICVLMLVPYLSRLDGFVLGPFAGATGSWHITCRMRPSVTVSFCVASSNAKCSCSFHLQKQINADIINQA